MGEPDYYGYKWQPGNVRVAENDTYIPEGQIHELRTTDWGDENFAHIRALWPMIQGLDPAKMTKLASSWKALASHLTSTKGNLRRHTDQLAPRWTGEAASTFLEQVGGALYSLEHWSEAATKNAAAINRLAEDVATTKPKVEKIYNDWLAESAREKTKRDADRAWVEKQDVNDLLGVLEKAVIPGSTFVRKKVRDSIPQEEIDRKYTNQALPLVKALATHFSSSAGSGIAVAGKFKGPTQFKAVVPKAPGAPPGTSPGGPNAPVLAGGKPPTRPTTPAVAAPPPPSSVKPPGTPPTGPTLASAPVKPVLPDSITNPGNPPAAPTVVTPALSPPSTAGVRPPLSTRPTLPPTAPGRGGSPRPTLPGKPTLPGRTAKGGPPGAPRLPGTGQPRAGGPAKPTIPGRTGTPGTGRGRPSSGQPRSGQPRSGQPRSGQPGSSQPGAPGGARPGLDGRTGRGGGRPGQGQRAPGQPERPGAPGQPRLPGRTGAPPTKPVPSIGEPPEFRRPAATGRPDPTEPGVRQPAKPSLGGRRQPEGPLTEGPAERGRTSRPELRGRTGGHSQSNPDTRPAPTESRRGSTVVAPDEMFAPAESAPAIIERPDAPVEQRPGPALGLG